MKMKHLKHSTLVVIAILVAILGVLAQNAIGNNYYVQSSGSNSQSAGSVVYIENGVSGVVSITDPFVNKTTDITVEYAPLDSGSGFIVNSNGYIITAFHVVGDPLTLTNNNTLKLMNSTDVQNYIEKAAVEGYISDYNPQLGSELVTNSLPGNPMIIQAQPDVNSTTAILIQRKLITVKSSKQQVKVKLSGSTGGNSINANIVDVGNSNKDQDVALLKINTLFQNLNPLSISSTIPNNGDGVTAYGYPVLSSGMYSDFNQSIIKPSKTSGQITGALPNNGTVFYETNAVTRHGYSGGPVLNSKNNVLGIIIYSIVSNNQQGNVTSSLFLSSDYIIQLCNKNNVTVHMD
jgi:S1-C subfamily serine protease